MIKESASGSSYKDNGLKLKKYYVRLQSTAFPGLLGNMDLFLLSVLLKEKCTPSKTKQTNGEI